MQSDKKDAKELSEIFAFGHAVNNLPVDATKAVEIAKGDFGFIPRPDLGKEGCILVSVDACIAVSQLSGIPMESLAVRDFIYASSHFPQELADRLTRGSSEENKVWTESNVVSAIFKIQATAEKIVRDAQLKKPESERDSISSNAFTRLPS